MSADSYNEHSRFFNQSFVHFLLCAFDRPGDGLLAVGAGGEEPGDAEVGDLGGHVGVEEHVRRLEVPVDDVEPRVPVEVEDAPGDAQDDAQPRLPAQRRAPPLVCSNNPMQTHYRIGLNTGLFNSNSGEI